MSIVAIAFPLDFQQPVWLWLCLLIPVLILATLRSLSGLDPVRRVLAVTLRCTLVLLLACCLAGIERVRRNDDLTVIFLMDRSYSVESLQAFQEEFVRESTRNIRADDRVGLIDFARHAYLQQMPMRGGYYLPPGRLPQMQNTDRTDVAAAVRLAMAMFPHDTAKRIVLMSDGNDNIGDLITEARRARADGIPIDVVPLQYKHRNEVYFERMIAPTYAEPGEQVPIRMVINSQQRASARLAIYHNGKLHNISPEDSRVDLEPGSNTFYIKLPIETAGTQTYEAVLTVDDDSMDTVAMNNTARAFSFVAGASPVLIVTSDRSRDVVLFDALRSERVVVEMKTPDQLGAFTLLQMMNYSSIILSNVAAATFTDRQQEELAIFVKDMGSGLIMLGGPDSFGAGGWIGSPIEEVMPVTFEIKHKRIIPRGALVLIMHSCEIPRGNFWGKEMAKKSVDTISSKDYLGVLAYTYTPGGENWEVPLDLNTNKAAVKARIDRMQIGDMPDFGRTMQMAYKELTSGRGRDAAQKHVIILSDGDAQAPTQKLLQDYADAKISVSTIAIGWGAHVRSQTLIDIARKTGGRFYAARNPRELPQIFSKESSIVRRPLIVEESFRPQLISASADLLGGLRAGQRGLPELGGMVLTSAKQSPNVLVPIVRATDDGEDPVLAYWQYELGKTVAFTSGYWSEWGKQWMPWPRFAKFWAQVVRWTMRQESPANFDTYTKVDGNRGRIVIDALDKDASYLNDLQLRANLVNPGADAVPIHFVQTGPGHYEAEFPVDKSGQYLANVQIYNEGKHMGTVRTGLSVPFSPEYRDLSPNEALLHNVAEITGGRWLDMAPEKADVFSHDLPPSEAKRPAWAWVLAWLFLPAFLLDVAVRRLANWLAISIAVEIVVLAVLLFGMDIRFGPWWGIAGAIILAELIGWTIRFRYIGPLFDFVTHGATALAHAGERSTASLEQLKSARDRARDDRDEQPLEGLKRIDEKVEPRSERVAKRRFDAGDVSADKPAGDLGDALGGAKSIDPSSPQSSTKKPAGDKDDQSDESTTSRLLRARKRPPKDKGDEE